MLSITIRHVPKSVRDTLAARAAASGRSLQEYMLAEVTRLASKPSLAELLSDVENRKATVGGDPLGAEMILALRDSDRK